MSFTDSITPEAYLCLQHEKKCHLTLNFSLGWILNKLEIFASALGVEMLSL